MAGVRAGRHAFAMPNYVRCFVPGHPVFLTLVTAGRRPWLRDDAAKASVIVAMTRVRDHYPFGNLGYVILDDHLHWLVRPAPGTNVSLMVGSLKRAVMAIQPSQPGKLAWQSRFYDHVIRDDNDWRRHLDYIHFNPVKHGYCDAAAAYRWSSFERWFARGAYTVDWGRREPVSIRAMTAE
jgi:putative transposase